MPESTPPRHRQDPALTPTNRDAPLGRAPPPQTPPRLRLHPSCGRSSVPVPDPAHAPRSFACRNEVPQPRRLPQRTAAALPPAAKPTPNRRASIPGHHRPPPDPVAPSPRIRLHLVTLTPPRRDHFSPHARLPKGHVHSTGGEIISPRFANGQRVSSKRNALSKPSTSGFDS